MKKIEGTEQLVSFKKGVKMNIIEIRKMSMIEPIQAMEALWDSLIAF